MIVIKNEPHLVYLLVLYERIKELTIFSGQLTQLPNFRHEFECVVSKLVSRWRWSLENNAVTTKKFP